MLVFNISGLKGQGCSDAGFCTLESFKPFLTEEGKATPNKMKIGLSWGEADYNITVFSTYLEYTRQLNEKLSLNTKITSLSQSGNEISVFGFSDLYLNANYKLANKLMATFGTKIPLSDGNRKYENLPLPLDYQASLGTLDLILGMSYQIFNFQIVAAWQQPLNHNRNSFFAENYPADSRLSDFQSTNNYVRSGDVLLRLSYPVSVGKKLSFTPGILPIYHLTNDKFTDLMGREQEIEGSQGLTLNGNLYLDYELNPANSIQLNTGMPFISRDARPDGLTRSFVVSLEYQIRF